MYAIRAAVRPASTTVASLSFARPLSTTIVRGKSVTETVKETADAINKKVGQTLASGIEGAQKAAESTQDTIASKTPSKEDISSKTEELKQTANQKLGEAADTARDAKNDVKKNL